MSTHWRNVENKCLRCNESVGKISIKSGKIVVESYLDNWGGWCKVPHKSEMKVLCNLCRKTINKEDRKMKKEERQ